MTMQRAGAHWTGGPSNVFTEAWTVRDVSQLPEMIRDKNLQIPGVTKGRGAELGGSRGAPVTSTH